MSYTNTSTDTDDRCVVLNRQSADGAVIELRKANAQAGIIGVKTSSLYIGTADAGIGFNHHAGGDLDSIMPYSITAGAFQNGKVDIGGSVNRFKDAFLSGGIHLGGNGAANKLDDYEEGTWTPGITHGSTAATVTDLGASGSYTKIGRMVTLNGNVKVATVNGNGTAVLTGFPFTVGDTVAVTGVEASGSIGYYANWGDNVNSLFLTATAGTTTGEVYGNHNASGLNSSATPITQAELNATAEFRFTITYFA